MSNSEKRREPRVVAERLFRERYPEAQALFCGGSIVHGEGTPTSDLDVVVVFERVERAWRDSFYFQGYPVEVFVHDHETLAYFVDHDEKRGRPCLAQMIREALVVPHLDSSAERLQEWARKREVIASRGAWSGVGKSLPRALRALDPELASALDQGFDQFFRTGDRAPAIAAVLRAIEPFGGELFEGYHAEAPGDWRVSRDAVPWLG